MRPNPVLSREQYQKIGPNIRPLVQALNELGVITRESSEGSLDENEEPYPWISIDYFKTPEYAMAELFDVLADLNQDLSSLNWVFTPLATRQIAFSGFHKQLLLSPLERNLERSPDLLDRFWKDARDIARRIRELKKPFAIEKFDRR